MQETKNLYRWFLQRLLRNYIVGSLIAVLGVGGALVFSTLHLSTSGSLILLGTLIVSVIIMFSVESIAFWRHLRPIHRVLSGRAVDLAAVQSAYLRAHRFPLLTVRRVLGPHLMGLAIPEIIFTAIEIHEGWLQLPYSLIFTASLAGILVACMHCMVEYFLATTAVQPVIKALQTLSVTSLNTEISLEGQVLVSIRTKFLLSALFIGILPLLLFSLATQEWITQISADSHYWQWALGVLVIGVGFAALGAWLLWVTVRHPISQLQNAMLTVQKGNLQVRATDYYSDEFSKLVAGFNHMTQGLAWRDAQNTQLLDSYFSTLAAALDARDPYTAGHSVRVAQYALQIGRGAALPAETLANLRKCALLHDIGKIGVSDSILLKDGRLTDAEFDQMKKHPALGEAILRQVQPQDAMAPLLPGVRSHHERYDGKGYPDGTKGEDTPLFGRIIAVADAFDAMTSDRPYRRGMPVGKALSILSEGRATQWDPVFAELFITWANDNLLTLERTRELAQVMVEDRAANS